MSFFCLSLLGTKMTYLLLKVGLGLLLLFNLALGILLGTEKRRQKTR